MSNAWLPVAEPRPEVDPPRGGPAGRLIAANLERAFHGGREFGRAAHVDVVPGEETEQVRHVPVVDLRRLHVPVVEPFLQLAGAADLRRRQPRASRAPPPLQVGIGSQGTCRLDRVAEQLAHDRLVHRRPHRQRRAERMGILGRQRRRGDEPVVRRLLDERVEEELRRAFQQRVDALQIAAIAGVFIAIPERPA